MPALASNKSLLMHLSAEIHQSNPGAGAIEAIRAGTLEVASNGIQNAPEFLTRVSFDPGVPRRFDDGDDIDDN
jgi:hypothetical protein